MSKTTTTTENKTTTKRGRGRPKGTPKELRIQVEVRQTKVAHYYKRGYSQGQIAELTGYDAVTICNDIRQIRQKWLNTSLIDFNEAKVTELAKIDETEKEAWEAWERSKQNAEVRKTKKTPRLKVVGENGKSRKPTHITTEELTVEGQVGDPKFLDVVNRCRDQRCKILGLYQDINITQNNNTVNISPEHSRLFELLKRVDPKLLEEQTEKEMLERVYDAKVISEVTTTANGEADN